MGSFRFFGFLVFFGFGGVLFPPGEEKIVKAVAQGAPDGGGGVAVGIALHGEGLCLLVQPEFFHRYPAAGFKGGGGQVQGHPPLGGVPFQVMAILFVLFLGAGVTSFILVMIITGWIGMSRMIRAQFYRYKDYEYVLASRTMGAKDRTLIFRHILPNAIGPIITQATFAVPSAIFSESFLSYLGLGIQAPEPSIGVLLAEGQGYLTTDPHLTLFPALVISALMLAFNLFGNGLRDAFDPRMRGL